MVERAQAELKATGRRRNPVAWRSGGLKRTESARRPERERPEGAGLTAPCQKTRIGKPMGGPDFSPVGVAAAVRFGGGALGARAGAVGPRSSAAPRQPGRRAGLSRRLAASCPPSRRYPETPRPSYPRELCPRMSARPEPACAVGRPGTRSWWVRGPLGGGPAALLLLQDPSSRCSSSPRI